MDLSVSELVGGLATQIPDNAGQNLSLLRRSELGWGGLTYVAGPPVKRLRDQSGDLFDGFFSVLHVVEPIYGVEHAKDTTGVVRSEDHSILRAHAQSRPHPAHLERRLTRLLAWLRSCGIACSRIFGDLLVERLHELDGVDAEIHKRSDRHAVAGSEETQQQVLGSDVLVTQVSSLDRGQSCETFGQPWCELPFGSHRVGLGLCLDCVFVGSRSSRHPRPLAVEADAWGHDGPDLPSEILVGHPKTAQDGTAHVVIGFDNPEKQVLGTGVIVVEEECLVSHLEKHSTGSVGEIAVHA